MVWFIAKLAAEGSRLPALTFSSPRLAFALAAVLVGVGLSCPYGFTWLLLLRGVGEAPSFAAGRAWRCWRVRHA